MIKKIASTFKKAREEEKDINEEELIALLGADEGVSRRTALDYINSAKTTLDREEAGIE